MATLSDGNYTGLKASLGDWLHRSDLSDTDLGNFVYLFEAEFNTTMRLRKMQAQTTIGITAGYLPHPSDWQGWKNIVVNSGGNKYNLSPLADESGNVLYGTLANGLPKGYVVKGDKTYLIPYPDSSYTVDTTYYQGVPSLAASSTNWLMTKFPQCYLYGSLLQARAFIPNDAELGKWQAAFSTSMDQVEKESMAASFGGAVPHVRPDSAF